MKTLKETLEYIRTSEGELFSLSENEFEAAVTHETENPTSWIIRVVTMVGAWIAAGCFFGVVALLGIFNSPLAVFILGILLMTAAMIAFRALKSNPFSIPFALTASITGQICFGYGLSEFSDFKELDLLFLAGIGVQVLLFFATINNTQKFIATFLFNCLLTGYLLYKEVYDGIHLVAGLNALLLTVMILWEEKILTRFKQWISSYQPLSAAVTLSFLLLLFVKLSEQTHSWQVLKIRFWEITSIIILVCILLTIYKVSQDFQWNPYKTLPMGIILLPLVGSPGILGGILILILGFYHKSIWFVAMGILALSVFISVFYYNLQLTLWVKSLILMGSGLLFLGVYLILRKYSLSLAANS
ncbi:MAG: DUF4401 domain-containing protein [Bacteroidia bacterium]|nr:DUF4401 domain-containing protein [Bacteroidia bacterium]